MKIAVVGVREMSSVFSHLPADVLNSPPASDSTSCLPSADAARCVSVARRTESFNRLHHRLTPPRPTKGVLFPLLLNALSLLGFAGYVDPILSLAAVGWGAGLVAFQGALSQPAPRCACSVRCLVKEGLGRDDAV